VASDNTPKSEGLRPPQDESPLVEAVYDQLRRIARRQLSHESPNHSLQPTELVHEVYLKLQDSPLLAVGRAQFLFAAAVAMRRILIDHARTRGRQKRGGGWQRVATDVLQFAREADSDDVLALDEAICRLEKEQPETAAVVKLRFFAGLTVEETAEAMGLSPRTVKREWQFARAWLFRELQP
jgi:RNA polymerase sigma factor (TIGR02999 family)